MSENNLKEVDHFVELVQHIVNKPGMFLVNNIEDLGLIISGYLMGVSHMKGGEALIDYLSGFRAFVNRHFESTFDYDWERLIRFHSSGDTGSLILFKQLFQEYISSSY